MAAGAKDSYLSIIPWPVLHFPNRQCGADKDGAMANTNVIDFALALQRRRERQNDRAAYAGHNDPWRNLLREGIDGLLTMQQVWASPGEVLPFVTTRRRPPAKAD